MTTETEFEIAQY